MFSCLSFVYPDLNQIQTLLGCNNLKILTVERGNLAMLTT